MRREGDDGIRGEEGYLMLTFSTASMINMRI